MKRKKVIIDCDPGIDDSLALIYALKSKELDVKAITIVSGNVDVHQGAENAKKVLSLCGREDIPIIKGQINPIKRELVTAQDTHGMDGLGETNFKNIDNIEVKEGAIDYIIQSLEDNKNLSIIALGPLTNIALALRKNKEVFNNLDEFVSMGGSFRSHGNCSPVAEFNYWVDPHAANYVFQNLPKPVQMVGLDVTRKIVLTPNIIQLIKNIDSKISRFIEEITKFYIDFHWKQEKIIGCVINDPLAVSYFLNKDICDGFSAHTKVVEDGLAMGQTIVDVENFWKLEDNSYILTEVDAHRFMDIFLFTIFDDNEIINKLGDIII